MPRGPQILLSIASEAVKDTRKPMRGRDIFKFVGRARPPQYLLRGRWFGFNMPQVVKLILLWLLALCWLYEPKHKAKRKLEVSKGLYYMLTTYQC